MKYIDAEKLIAEVERLSAEHTSRWETDEVALVLDKLEDFIISLQQEQKPEEDWREKRKEECPFRKANGCERYADVISECTGNCSWVVDYPKLKEIQDKKEQKPEAKLTGWVARDSEHNPYSGLGLVLFKEKPIRYGDCWSGAIVSQLPWKLFPDLKWEDEPIEVEVEVTIRKKIDINSI